MNVEQNKKVRFKDYEGLVRNFSYKYRIPSFDFDDYLQEAHLIFFHAKEKFNAERRVTFGLYYKVLLKNHFINLLRRSQTSSRKVEYDRQFYQTDFYVAEEGENAEEEKWNSYQLQQDLPQMIDDLLHYRENYEAFLKSLTSIEMAALRKNMEEKFFVSPTHSYNCALSRVKKKFKRIVLEME